LLEKFDRTTGPKRRKRRKESPNAWLYRVKRAAKSVAKQAAKVVPTE
jgi:hypothetical protein